MEQLKIVVLFGGNSPEYSVSLQSAYAIISHMDRKKYKPLSVGISASGSWFLFCGDIHKIENDTWLNDIDCIPVTISPNRDAHTLLTFQNGCVEQIEIDAVFPVLHGRNGEDGTVQGMIELAGIPLVGCGVLASALAMDKYRAHLLVHAWGISTPNGQVLNRSDSVKQAEEIAKELGYPLFIKPVRAGSSYGITKVFDQVMLKKAVELAFAYDTQIIMEQAIDGFEVGCAVLGNQTLIIGEPDEIELSQGFFDFTEKYSLKTSSIHVPARISQEKASEVKKIAQNIYRILGCEGFARVDMFLTPKGEIVFNEVNTIPGFTAHSRFPAMLKEIGMSYEQIITTVIELAIEKER